MASNNDYAKWIEDLYQALVDIFRTRVDPYHGYKYGANEKVLSIKDIEEAGKTLLEKNSKEKLKSSIAKKQGSAKTELDDRQAP